MSTDAPFGSRERAAALWRDFFDLVDEYGGVGDDFLTDRDEGLVEHTSF